MTNKYHPNRFWTLKRFGPRYYTATRIDGEHRIYYSFEALERDFGTVKFEEKEEGT